jgi:energy-coupling factor transporter ATP-binding protein EcfA2
MIAASTSRAFARSSPTRSPPSSPPSARPLEIEAFPRPQVILVIGVNGSGKTTTIAKLAHLLQEQDYEVMLVAGDTFRRRDRSAQGLGRAAERADHLGQGRAATPPAWCSKASSRAPPAAPTC